ncbi:FkbM family methyltransferase [Nocardia nova]
MKRIVKRGDTVIDVGAHFGIHTRFLAALVGDSGRVFALEPDPYNFRLLRRNTCRLSNVSTLNVAAGRSRRRANIRQYRGVDTGLTSFGEARLLIDGKPPRMRSTSMVSVWPLVEIPELAGLTKLSLIKIDVEGGAHDALAGMKELIISMRPHIIFEVGDFGHLPDRSSDLVLTLRRWGYRVDIPANMMDDGQFRHGNLVACPNGAEACAH